VVLDLNGWLEAEQTRLQRASAKSFASHWRRGRAPRLQVGLVRSSRLSSRRRGFLVGGNADQVAIERNGPVDR